MSSEYVEAKTKLRAMQEEGRRLWSEEQVRWRNGPHVRVPEFEENLRLGRVLRGVVIGMENEDPSLIGSCCEGDSR